LIVVDDASPANVADPLAKTLHEEAPGSTLLRHRQNRGKGGAVMTGLRAAHAAGFTHALQIDGDGQHDAGDIPAFLEAASENPRSLICGQPQFGGDISKLRYYARYLTLSLSWLETLSTQIRDALCGFRIYPLASVVDILDNSNPGSRMAFDPEILVRAIWAGIALHFVPVRVVYPQGGRSHFHYIEDNIEISWMHTRLIFGMFLRIPRLIRYKRSRTSEQAVT
jgi:glycosyltransferase involved in cell wall biosynthesis